MKPNTKTLIIEMARFPHFRVLEDPVLLIKIDFNKSTGINLEIN